MLAAVSLSIALLPGSSSLVGRSPTPQQFAGSAIVRPLRASNVVCQATTDAPPKLESSCGFDFVPLLTALQTGEFREADQLTRDGLIKLAGDAAVKPGYVYYTEVPKLPVEDMATIDRLWQHYSDGKFGYAVQAAAFATKKVDGNFDRLFERIGWKNKDGSLLRWLPEAKADEFIYDQEKAPKGHLPLTSTLRGQQLLKGLLVHPAWETDEFKDIKF